MVDRCAYCGKVVKHPAWMIKIDMDIPPIYFCNEMEALTWEYENFYEKKLNVEKVV